MKYEEWIKYEEMRRKHPELNNWQLLEQDAANQQKSKPNPTQDQEKPRGLSAILQVFNPRKI